MSDAPAAELLALVPGAARGARIERLGHAPARGPWRVTGPAGDFVLHRRHADGERGAAVTEGLELQRHAAQAGIASRVVAIEPRSASHVVEYAPGSTWTEADLAAPDAPARLGGLLARLHALPPPRAAGHAPSHPLAAIEIYARGAADASAEIERARLWSREVRAGARAAAITHFDLHAGNVVDDGTSLRLIDWEYARIADPIWDLAGLAALHPAVVLPRLGEWMRASGLAAHLVPGEFAAALRLCELMNALWARSAGREH